MRDKSLTGIKDKEFKKYQNHVQRFKARLSTTVDDLYVEGHVDQMAIERITKVLSGL